jgi:hypothetical protein
MLNLLGGLNLGLEDLTHYSGRLPAKEKKRIKLR